MSFYDWRPYVPVAERRAKAERQLAKMRKKGRPVSPVKIEGRTIARSFWGGAWCDNLEGYSDYDNRLPRGRTYVRNGSVVDLQIERGKVTALVAGSSLYTVEVAIDPVAGPRWKAICRDCAGTVASLVELLQGRLAGGVMERVCRPDDGLFPAPKEIGFSCSCPDWADMCKHVAAVLYGVGARLDQKPELLFVLRGVDENELIAGASRDLSLGASAPDAAKVLEDGDLAGLFGLEMAETADTGAAAPKVARPPKKQVAKRAPAAKAIAPTPPAAKGRPASKTAVAAGPNGRRARKRA